MDKEKIFNHFSAILDNMLDNSLFFCTYFQCPSSLDKIIGKEEDKAVPENISIYFGISRGCIIDKNFDYVVKFDIESDDFGDSISAREVELYHMAKNNNLEKYFAPAVFIGEYVKTISFYHYSDLERYVDWYEYNPQIFDEDFADNEEKFGKLKNITISIPLYAYPKANGYIYSKLNWKEEEDCFIKAKSIKSPLRLRQIQIAMEFIYKYGMPEYERLSSFMRENHINDLHRDNFGNLNGNIVAIDYGGFHSYDDDEDDEYSND